MELPKGHVTSCVYAFPGIRGWSGLTNRDIVTIQSIDVLLDCVIYTSYLYHTLVSEN